MSNQPKTEPTLKVLDSKLLKDLNMKLAASARKLFVN